MNIGARQTFLNDKIMHRKLPTGFKCLDFIKPNGDAYFKITSYIPIQDVWGGAVIVDLNSVSYSSDRKFFGNKWMSLSQYSGYLRTLSYYSWQGGNNKFPKITQSKFLYRIFQENDEIANGKTTNLKVFTEFANYPGPLQVVENTDTVSVIHPDHLKNFNDSSYYLDFAFCGLNVGEKDNFYISDGVTFGTTCSGVSIFQAVVYGKDNKIIVDLQPALDTNNTPCVVNTITQEVFYQYPQSSGSIIPGNIIDIADSDFDKLVIE